MICVQSFDDMYDIYICMIYVGSHDVVVYYESLKRELKTRPIYECRCDERLKTKAEESTRLAYAWLLDVGNATPQGFFFVEKGLTRTAMASNGDRKKR